MAIWVDSALWPAHDRRWAHVISDESLDELHAFAALAGIPRRSFEGDHYDVPEERLAGVVAAGATATTAGDLARRLQRSGLRFRKRRGERPLARVVDGLPAVGGPHVLDVVASPHEPPASSGAAVVIVTAPGPRLVMVLSSGRDGWAPPGGKVDSGEDVRQAAVREIAEETGLMLKAPALTPVGYERVTIAEGQQRGMWRAGDNRIAVFGTELSWAAPVQPTAADVVQARWFGLPEANELSGTQSWWPLVEHWAAQAPSVS